MLFNSVDFLIFFAIVYFSYIKLNRVGQNVLLLVAGIIFYGYWDWRFLSLIFVSIASDYFFGIKIYEAKDRSRKKLFITCSIFVNLSLLAVFKYYNFFADNLVWAAARFGYNIDWVTLNILLPVGISFYTFQSLSYTIDIYRDRMPPERNIFTFAVFVLFFPQLLAGPIERAVALIPQLEKKRTITLEDIKVGSWLIVWGYYLKVFLADNIAKGVDVVYGSTGAYNPLEVVLGAYGFAFQILGDFAGYSSIAIGLARLMGFRLMTNFLYPYFVTNPQQFWHNWHISLSTWLRDYLYISLGGNRGGPLKTYRNLFLTMFLGGIWHGANWPYFIWGVYQGGILIIHRLLFEDNKGSQKKVDKPSSPLRTFINIIIMFQITCIGWLIFRAGSAQQIFDMLGSLFSDRWHVSALADSLVLKILFYATPTMCIQYFNWRRNDQFAILRIGDWRFAAMVLLMLFSIAFWGEFNAQQFIYFQF